MSVDERQPGISDSASRRICVHRKRIVQRDTDDPFRGRAFALYDVVYNAAFVGAAALAALVLPDAGYSRAVFAALALVYLATAGIYRARSRPRQPAG